MLLVQWAKRFGAHVIGTVSTERKAAISREAGADEMIVYTETDFVKETLRVARNHGADVIFDGVGKSTFN